jgi:hypothetical protein
MLCVVAFALLLLIGVCAYLMIDRSAPPRGSAGPLTQNSPGRDPPPSLMR